MRTKSMILLGAAIAAAIGIGWANATPKTSGVDPGSAVRQVAPDALDSVAESFASYERIRSLLTEDKVEGLSKEAERLAKVSGRAADRSQEASASSSERRIRSD